MALAWSRRSRCWGRSTLPRRAGRCRSARPRSSPGGNRCSELAWLWAVELRREKSRCRLQDRVRAAQLADFLLQLTDPPSLIGRNAGNVAAVDLRPTHPAAQRVEG